MSSIIAGQAPHRRATAQTARPPRAARQRAAILTIALLLSWQPAVARTWVVGPDQPLKKLSEAVRHVADGDVVQIKPQAGGYYDCVIWPHNNVTIEGVGDDVRLTDTTCAGKAVFVAAANGITIRNLTFARARAADGNGAGIRVEGGDLVIEHSRFIDNQVGLLAADRPAATITIRSSVFRGNGTCRDFCTDTLVTGALLVLHVEDSIFADNHGRDVVRSRAAATELVGNRIEQSQPVEGGYVVELPSGGSLVLQDTRIELRNELATGAAVLVATGYGSGEIERLIVRDNVVVAEGAVSGGALLRNWTSGDADARGNTLPSGMRAISTSGYWWFLTKSYLRTTYDYSKGRVRRMAAQVYHLIIGR